MYDPENQLEQPLSLNNAVQNAAEKSSYDARVLEISDPVSLQILLVPVRLIFEDNSKSPNAFEEETVKNLTQAKCPITRRNVIGYIYDNDKKAEVAAFFAENPVARSLQYTNGTWLITTRINNLMPSQRFHLIKFSDVLMVALGGIIISAGVGAVHLGGFLAASSALGSTIMQDDHQEISRQAQTAWVGGAITTATTNYLTLAYRFFYINRVWKNHEVAATIITTFIFAGLASIPLGVQIVPFKEHNSIGLMMAKQLLGASILAVGLAVIVYFREKNSTENDFSEATTREREKGPLIPFLSHYVEPSAPISTTEATASSTNRLQLASLNRGLYPDQQNVKQPSSSSTQRLAWLPPANACQSAQSTIDNPEQQMCTMNTAVQYTHTLIHYF